jgi:hypothetical protein
MKKIPKNIFNKIEVVAKHVVTDLKNRGYIVPVQQEDGSIKFNSFTVKKNNGFYSVLGRNNKVVVDSINLPQTAALLANDLALGKLLDKDIVNLDKDYGYKLFDETVYSTAARRKKNNIDQVIFYETRCEIAKFQKLELKNRILNSFKKLTSIR